jgi:steroid 5-alpha reductase family enzyme
VTGIPDRSIARGRVVAAGAYVLALGAAVVTVIVGPSISTIWLAAVADLVGTAVIFEFSRRLDNSSMYDPYWSVAPIAIAGYWWATGIGLSTELWRPFLVVALVLVWGARLTGNWVYRWQGLRDEDWRYVMLRIKHGRRYWVVSWFGIHLLPTVLVFLGCLPLYAVLADPRVPFSAFDLVPLVVTSASIWIEARADFELVRFRASAPDSSETLDTGLWRLCRHPNYLGEVLFWWGLFGFGLAANPAYWWTGVGAVAITLLFKYISVPMIDERMLERRPGYADRMRQVPAMIPRLRSTGK